MRSETEMLDLIISTAENDKRILAVYMNGSRTNPNAPKDIFQDFDIIYVVNETKTFREEKDWIDRFGKRLYMQYPEESVYFPSEVDNCYGWLIQFADGNRLDLHVCTLDESLRTIENDRLCKILLDKNKILPVIPAATDADFWIKKPTQAEFQCTCNEFWWCLNNVAKGLWREEIPYCFDMLNLYIRPMLMRLLEWQVGIATNFSVSAGKSGKYLYRWLPKQVWESLLKTYAAGIIQEIWKSTFLMCDLFHTTAMDVANNLQFDYDIMEANNSLKYLKDVYLLPKDAEKLY